MRALKKQLRSGGFSNWALGRAQTYLLVAKHYPKDAKFWRSLMRDNALMAVKDARFNLLLAQ
jgi:hypothetical protein